MLPEEDRRIGTVIDGRYRPIRVIGSGGMGVVYRAEHLLLRQEVALKLLHTYLQDHPRGAELKRRFLREAQSLARLDRQHPHLAPVIDCGVCDDGTLYMAMELLEGEALGDVLKRGALLPARALHICAQVLRTLVHAHGKGIVHRDLKPDNIMLTRSEGREDFVKVLDFGIAKLLREAELAPPFSPQELQDLAKLRATPLTRAGIIFGTPEYISPEQAQGQEVDQRADLYAVGCVLWEMLTGRRPFVGTSALEVISLHLTAAPDPPSKHALSALPRALDELVLRAMAKDPAERFESAEAFLRALDVVLWQLPRGGTPTALLTPVIDGLRRALTIERRALPPPPPRPAAGAPPPPPTAWQRLSRRLGLRGAALLAAAALVLGGMAVGTVTARLLRGARSAPRTPAHPTAPAPPGGPALQEPPPPAARPALAIGPLLERLQDGRSCEARRSAALALLAVGDPRALGALEAARRRAVGKRAPNACMRRDLDEAIEKLRAATAPAGVDSKP